MLVNIFLKDFAFILKKLHGIIRILFEILLLCKTGIGKNFSLSVLWFDDYVMHDRIMKATAKLLLWSSFHIV